MTSHHLLSMHPAVSATNTSLNHYDLNDNITIHLTKIQRVKLQCLIVLSNDQSCLTPQVCKKQVKLSNILAINKCQV